MKLSEYARVNSIQYNAAWIQFKRGLIPSARQLPTGTIVVDDPKEQQRAEYTVVYTRVSSSENRSNLKGQSNRVCMFCQANGWIVNEIVEECASGLNDRRPKLSKILQDPNVTRIVVEHKDRLTRFGFEYIRLLFKGTLVVVNEVTEDEEDLIQDFTSIITSFCARIYGKRRSKRKTEKLIKDLASDD